MEFHCRNMSKRRLGFLSVKISIVWDTVIDPIVEIQNWSSQEGMNDL